MKLDNQIVLDIHGLGIPYINNAKQVWVIGLNKPANLNGHIFVHDDIAAWNNDWLPFGGKRNSVSIDVITCFAKVDYQTVEYFRKIADVLICGCEIVEQAVLLYSKVEQIDRGIWLCE